MFINTKIALAAALILGTASAALANDSGENDTGGYVMAGSMVGVNPAYHPDLFGKADKAYASANLSQSRQKGHNR
jgi:hypothetical protein